MMDRRPHVPGGLDFLILVEYMSFQYLLPVLEALLVLASRTFKHVQVLGLSLGAFMTIFAGLQEYMNRMFVTEPAQWRPRARKAIVQCLRVGLEASQKGQARPCPSRLSDESPSWPTHRDLPTDQPTPQSPSPSQQAPQSYP